MKIIDKYILKRYLITFFFVLLILIPIAVAIDISEKIDKFLFHQDLTVWEIITDYYVHFIVYYSNTFMPLALFLATIFFTSKLSNNTEIVAITNAKVSFLRFLYPYFIGATIVMFFSLLMNHFVVPNSNKIRGEFEQKYITKKKLGDDSVRDFSLQLSDSTYVYIKNFGFQFNGGSFFSYETYNGLQLKEKLTANNINWNPKDSTFKLLSYKYRRIYKDRDSVSSGINLDTTFNFTPRDLMIKSTISQEMGSLELSKFIKISKKRGVSNLNSYLVELYKRTSLPIATYILTLIAVALAFKKKRGGLGVNLSLGIGVMFVYIFFLKIGEVLGAVAGAVSILYVWFPNIMFSGIAAYFYNNARK